MTGRIGKAQLTDLADMLTEVDQFLRSRPGTPPWRCTTPLAAASDPGSTRAISSTGSASPRCGCAARLRRRRSVPEFPARRARVRGPEPSPLIGSHRC